MYKSMEKVENVFIVFQKTFGEEGKEMSVHKLVKKQKTKESVDGLRSTSKHHCQETQERVISTKAILKLNDKSFRPFWRKAFIISAGQYQTTWGEKIWPTENIWPIIKRGKQRP